MKVHQTDILKLGILIKRKGKKGANPNAERKTTKTQNPPGTHSTHAKYVIDILYTFYGIWLSCAVESWLLHIVYVWFNLQPHINHTSHWVHAKYVLYTHFFFSVYWHWLLWIWVILELSAISWSSVTYCPISELRPVQYKPCFLGSIVQFIDWIAYGESEYTNKLNVGSSIFGYKQQTIRRHHGKTINMTFHTNG